MALSHSTRLAWSVAFASLALWATSVPMTAGQVAAGATRLSDETLTPTADQRQTEVPATSTVASPCGAEAPTPAVVGTLEGGTTFHLCGVDAQAEQRIAQLIGGRGFEASLAAYGDGCADLTIRVQPRAFGGTASSHLAVSLGAHRGMRIDITSEAGVTQVSVRVEQVSVDEDQVGVNADQVGVRADQVGVRAGR